jgi:SAM-dependent methyltransferase
MSNKNQISSIDVYNLKVIRENVNVFLKELSQLYDRENLKILEIAPQIHEGCKKYFKCAELHTLDLDPNSNAKFTADLCVENNDLIPNETYDMVICTEVLEHTKQPFKAVDEIYRILKPSGIAAVSTPFNFRIHGPLPDCWRFTEHGLRELFINFDSCIIKSLDDEHRFLCPIHYLTIANK